MSDILIKGINLPVGQGVITITIAEDKSVSLATIRRMGGITEILCHTGQGKVVELPPHGRLIDADAMLEATRFWSFGRSDDYFDLKIKNTIIKAFLDTAPTVLEAREVVE